MENAVDVALVGHDIEDTHAAAALAADGVVDCEDAGEEMGPADAPFMVPARATTLCGSLVSPNSRLKFLEVKRRGMELRFMAW